MNEIIEIIKNMAGKFNEKEIFRDFITLTAISFSNAINKSKERESEYLSITKKYTDNELNNFTYLVFLIVEELEADPRDLLGEIFMKMDLGNSKDQYFTPINISKMMSEFLFDQKQDSEIHVVDPCCGSGTMIIAKALVLKDRGINYQKQMKVVAADIDRTVLLMCYIQLTLLGVDAICNVGDSLSESIEETWITPIYYRNRNLI
ncbi:N-6 DNA methylase [Enterococcus mundtii]|uniref:N-6 DNA methylase n=1 Tax=Enterococcus mundtii TaxID=53346 RepID=UPI001A97B580|nr:N-6 DNA methylase [Enterococcus mundtii]MBO1087147.1 N-6 DNA methylase [Enterococcus mundtii]